MNYGIAPTSAGVFWTEYPQVQPCNGTLENVIQDSLDLSFSSAQNAATNQTCPFAIASDGTTIYWLESISASGAQLMTLPVGSMSSPTAVGTPISTSPGGGVAIDLGDLFIAGSNVIYKLPSGSSTLTQIPLPGGSGGLRGVAVTSSMLYVADQGLDQIDQVGRNGTPSATQLVHADVGYTLFDVRTDGSFVYYAERANDSGSRLMRVPLSGSPAELLASTPGEPDAGGGIDYNDVIQWFDIDSNFAYFIHHGTVWAAPLQPTCGPAVSIVSPGGGSFIVAVRYYGNAVYFTDGAGNVNRAWW